MTPTETSAAETAVDAGQQPDPPAAPSDDQNPAIIDARKTFVITMISSVLFVGAILLFIL